MWIFEYDSLERGVIVHTVGNRRRVYRSEDRMAWEE